MSAQAEELAGKIVGIRFESHRLDHWLKQLREGSFKYGCGVLRDADDAFDPMGVLAEINDADWGYDTGEEAYTIDGEPMHLPVIRAREYLGIGPEVHTRTVMEFITAMGELADRLLSHQQFADALREAISREHYRRQRLQATIAEQRERDYPVMGDRYGYGRERIEYEMPEIDWRSDRSDRDVIMRPRRIGRLG